MRLGVWALLALSLAGCSSVRSVHEGQLYRAGQLSASQLEETIRDKNIKTVVNLRGPDPDKKWYRSEQEVCQRLGVKQVDIDLGTSEPDRNEVAALLDTYRQAEKPILVHSWSRYGSAGFASGVYRAAVLGEPTNDARHELAFWESYRWPIKTLASKDRFIRDWRGERDFYSGYQLDEDRQLPDPQFDQPMLADRRAEYRPRRGDESLPPPDMNYFRGENQAPTMGSQGSVDWNGSGVRPVVAFGRPVPVLDNGR
ncbi:hypothetical protein K2Y11_00970 [bacterium]|nr:hypothetical protein [bacterium]